MRSDGRTGIRSRAGTSVPAYTDLSELLIKEAVDVVVVATARVVKGSHHFIPTMAAIAAGKDVLVEKPISNK
jgi:UDP-N-acetylglucosamine 3-dehydrogenase